MAEGTDKAQNESDSNQQGAVSLPLLSLQTSIDVPKVRYFCQCCPFSYSHAWDLKTHTFNKHVNIPAFCLRRTDGVTTDDLVFFCVQEHCLITTLSHALYEYHLMTCCPLNNNLSELVARRLMATLLFLVDFHYKSPHQPYAGFLGYAAAFCRRDETYNKEKQNQITANRRFLSRSSSVDYQNAMMQRNPAQSFMDQSLGALSNNTSQFLNKVKMKKWVKSEALSGLSRRLANLRRNSWSGENSNSVYSQAPEMNSQQEIYALAGNSASISLIIGGHAEFSENRTPSRDFQSSSVAIEKSEGSENREPNPSHLGVAEEETGSSEDTVQGTNNASSVVTGEKVGSDEKMPPCTDNLSLSVITSEFAIGAAGSLSNPIYVSPESFEPLEKSLPCGENNSLSANTPECTVEATGSDSDPIYVPSENYGPLEKSLPCDEDPSLLMITGTNNNYRSLEGSGNSDVTNILNVSLGNFMEDFKKLDKQDLVKCPECNQEFNDNDLLKMHLKHHARKTPYTCHECCKGFSLKDHLNKHARTHKNEKPFKCYECGKTLSLKFLLQYHMKQHKHEQERVECGDNLSSRTDCDVHWSGHKGGNPTICTKCRLVFLNENDLNHHTTIAHRNDKRYTCEHCARAFIREEKLAEHIMRTHTVEKPFGCKLCTKNFGRICSLIRHIFTTHADDTCGNNFGHYSTIIKYETSYVSTPTVKCTDCDKKLSQTNTLPAHLNPLSKSQPFKCDICSRGRWNRQSLGRHLRDSAGKKRHICRFCGKSFGLKGILRGHLRMHTGEKPFKCGECGRIFSGYGNFTRHMRFHTREKPFKCYVCGLSFASKKMHFLREHTEKKLFVCRECYKIFERECTFHQQEEDHTVEMPRKSSGRRRKTSERRKVFQQNGNQPTEASFSEASTTFEKPSPAVKAQSTRNLTTRMESHPRGKSQSHTEKPPFFQKPQFVEKSVVLVLENPTSKEKASSKRKHYPFKKIFQCIECGQKFAYKLDLFNHMFIHVDQWAVKCDICEITFASPSELKNHLKMHRKKK